MSLSVASDDEQECRICRGPEEPGRPLFHPCKCSGSIKHTHEDCLVNWLAQSGTTRCELCNHPFRFEPLYQPNTPRALPPEELLSGLLSRTRSAVVTVARVTLVLAVWLVALPLGTCWTWYALFINSLGKLPRLIANRGLSGLMTDAFYGCLLSAGIVFVFLGVSSLREYIRHIPDDDAHANEFADDMEGDVFDDDELIDNVERLLDDPDLGPAPVPPVREEANEGHVFNPGAWMPGNPAGDRMAGNPDEGDGAVHGALARPDGSHLGGHQGNAGLNPLREVGLPPEAGPELPADYLDGVTTPGASNSNRHFLQTEEDDVRTRNEHRARPNVRRRQRHDRAEAMRDAADEVYSDEGNDSGGSSVLFDDLYAPDLPGLSTDEEGDADDVDDEIAEDRENIPFEDPNIGNDVVLRQRPTDLAHPRREDAVEADEDLRRDDGHPVLRLPQHVNDDVEVDADIGPLEADGRDGPVAGFVDGENGQNEDEEDENGALFGLFELDPDEVALDEMVGLRGHLRHLFDNAGTVLVSNAIFLGIFTLIPLLVGRLAIRVASLRTLALDLKTISVLLNSSQASHGDILAEGLDGIGLSDVAVTSADSLAGTLDGVDVSGLVPTVAAEEPIVSYVDNMFVVLLGYGCISLCAFGYVIVNSLLRSRYPRLDTPMTRQVVRVLRYVATFVKVVVLILFEFGIFPLGCGWWLDICTLDLMEATFRSRAAFCREFPWTCTAGHWFLGIVYMVHISLFVSLLRMFLRPELLWFLRDPDDPEYRPFRELVEKPLSRHARRMCLSVLIYAPLIVAIVYIPSQVCLNLLPRVFPLDVVDLSNSLSEVPLGNLVVIPLGSVLSHARPGALLRAIVHFWIERVGDLLGIQQFVMKPELLGGGQRNEVIVDGGLNENDVFAPFENDEDEAVDPTRDERLALVTHSREDLENEIFENDLDSRQVWSRGIFMLFLGWSTMVAMECVALTIPTVIGRYLIRIVGLPVSHDFYAVGLGLYVVFGVSEVTCRVHKLLGSVDARTAVILAFPYVVVVGKGLLLAVLWFGIAPLGAGILVELMVTVPLRVAHNESPYFYLLQDWALGLLLFKVWVRIVLAGGFTNVWRERLQEARAGGLIGVGVNFKRTVQDVVGPVLVGEAVALAVPYAFSFGLLRLLGASLGVCSFVYRNIYVWVVCIYVLDRAVGRVKVGLRALHDSIRDDKYLVGRRLYNYS